MVNMKPHHFIDMIKLHGAGYDEFVPDEHHRHSFYSVGNQILADKNTELMFTLDCDDVCVNCRCREGAVCTDSVSGLGEYTSKDAYNKMIDHAIIHCLELDAGRTYTAKEYCEILYRHKEMIRSVWTLEPSEVTDKRYTLFCKGAEQYLGMEV